MIEIASNAKKHFFVLGAGRLEQNLNLSRKSKKGSFPNVIARQRMVRLYFWSKIFLNIYSYPFPSLIVFYTLILLGWQCAPENGFPLSVFFGRALQTFPNWNKGNKGAGKYLDN